MASYSQNGAQGPLPNMVLCFTEALRKGLAQVPEQVTALSLPLLPGAAAALLVLALAAIYKKSSIIVLTAGTVEHEDVFGDLQSLAGEAGGSVLSLPALAGTADDDDPEVVGGRLLAAQALKEHVQRPMILVTTVLALQQPLADPDAAARATIKLRQGATAALSAVVAHLVDTGYERTHEVTEKGFFTVRGGIVDVWPTTTALPVRLEFLGDVVDSLRSFDPGSQISVSRLPEVSILPCKIATNSWPGVLLPPNSIVVRLDHDRIRQFAETHRLEIAGVLSWEKLERQLEAGRPRLQLYSGDPPPSGLGTLPLAVAPVARVAAGDTEAANHPDLMAAIRRRLLAPLAEVNNGGGLAVVCADTPGACEMLACDLPVSDPPIEVVCLPLSGGFALTGAASPELFLLAQPDLYVARKRTFANAKKAAGAVSRLDSLGELEIGDLVVHAEHGIGRYTGTTEVVVDGRRFEVISLEYAGSAKLHVPVAHVHLLSRYVGVGQRTTTLHRLGGKRWSREKSEAERAILDLAASLLDTQAKRQLNPGFSFDVAPAWIHPFETSFPYQETPDQERVIDEVKVDMAAARPMDRLICGDAGYGKTEIAMRAAFITVMNHRQVAILVPTTVLAEQHYATFRERMAPYPIRLATLSRFRSAGQCRQTLAELATGAVDIVIGTHALLQPGVNFHDLGLLIIDEEQRFGVRTKECLKTMRAMVDVLTLSATPIPRTLYLSMTGARDISLLQTPPRERLAIETRVVRDADNVVRSAIRQELARDGQVFYLHNRVLSLPLARARLERLVPEARIGVAHGQMAARELAATMRDFEAGATDLLLCTTLVESGLDIPRANTIIIDRADRFGIADLYQLRGRVGRSSRKGYAWLLLPDHGNIDDDARQRIAALRTHSGLGAGFALALRDMEIRGAGSMLGAAQSGHIAAIGFGLYCQLLKRTVARLKGEAAPLLVDVELTLDFIDTSPGVADPARAACLPYDYIEDEAHRMSIYRRIAASSAQSEIAELRKELADRFGKLPVAANRLLKLAELRVAAARHDIRRIEVQAHKVRLFRQGVPHPLPINGVLPQLKAGEPDKMIAQLMKMLNYVAKNSASRAPGARDR